MFLSSWFLVVSLNINEEEVKKIKQSSQEICQYRANIVNTEDIEVYSIFNAKCLLLPSTTVEK